ncbi:hypothetical protein D3C81_988770 [compost metagenome]
MVGASRSNVMPESRLTVGSTREKLVCALGVLSCDSIWYWVALNVTLGVTYQPARTIG